MQARFRFLLARVSVTAWLCLAAGEANLAAGTVQLARTGQEFCYGADGVVVPCPGSGQDGAWLAGVAWPAPRFAANADGTLTDALTGLTWLGDANCLATLYPSFDTDGIAGDGRVTWQHALSFVAGMNAGTYPGCAHGHGDWRLPNVNEMESLFHAGVAHSATWLGASGFAHVEYQYWSSTTYAPSTIWAWSVNLGGNSVGLTQKSGSSPQFLWPVRGTTTGSAQVWQTGQCQSYAAGDDGDLETGVGWTRTDVGRFRSPDGSFPITGEVVLDTLTGLSWTRDGVSPGPAACSPGAAKLWQQALTYVACLNTNVYLGHSDWRLPNSKELYSLFNYGHPNMPNWFYLVGFSNVASGTSAFFWTSTTSVDLLTYAIGGNLYWAGQIGAYNKAGSSFFVWPVRSDALAGPGHANLSVTGTDTPDPVTVYSNLTYELTVTNAGPDPATGVVLTDTLPAGASLALVTASQGTCTGTATVACGIGTLASGSHATVTITVVPATVGVLSNAPSVSATQTDPSPANNTLTLQTTVVTSSAGPVDVARTGQQRCFDAGGIQVSCNGTGQDGETQSGVAWPTPRLTTNGACVTDALTGLTWLRTPDSTLRTWQEALTYARSHEACGKTDWRLPNRKEMRSLVHPDRANSAAWLAEAAQGFGNVQGAPYWTSTTNVNMTHSAWTVDLSNGLIGGRVKSTSLNAWPVRGGPPPAASSLVWTGQSLCYDAAGSPIACDGTGQDAEVRAGAAWPSPRFTTAGECVADQLTGLVWLRAPDAAPRTWQEALVYAAGESGCGKSDWRLPNTNEIESLLHSGQLDTAAWLNGQGFAGLQPDHYWTSDTWAKNPTLATFVDLGYASESADTKSETAFALPVRSGVLLPPSHAGDVNGDGQVNVADVFYLINFLFAGGPAPIGPGDVNADGQVNVADVFSLINYLFAGGPPPA